MTLKNELLSLAVRLDAFCDIGIREIEALKCIFPILWVEWVQPLLASKWAKEADCYITACDACKYAGMSPDKFTQEQKDMLSIKAKEYRRLEEACGRFSVDFERLCQVSKDSVDAEEMLAVVYAFGCLNKEKNLKRAQECLKRPLFENRVVANLLNAYMCPEKRSDMIAGLSLLGYEDEAKALERYYGVSASKANSNNKIKGFGI